MTMSIQREPMPRGRRMAALALAATLMLALRVGSAQPESSQPAQQDHSQHGASPTPDEHAGHGDHPPPKRAVAPKAKTPAKKQAPSAHDNHGGHAPTPARTVRGSTHAGHAAPRSARPQHAGHAAPAPGGSQHAGDHPTPDHGMKGFLGPSGMSRQG